MISSKSSRSKSRRHVLLLAIVSWKNAATNPLLAVCLFGGASTSILGMGLRWWSYEIEEAHKPDKR